MKPEGTERTGQGSLDQDTIVAIATPPGHAGVGVVRLSGPRARYLAGPMLRLRHPLAAGQARFAEVIDLETGAVLDEAVVTFFAAPHSYTSDDVVEISAHGSPVLLDYLLRSAVERGGRLALPGEFTQRAFLSGRLDLTQAEAVAGLIEASTLHQARVAAAQLGGSLARAVAPIKRGMIDLIAALEAGVDFAEDDLDLMPQPDIICALARLEDPLAGLAATYRYGRVVRNGFSMAIVGRPNAGKSSLFNRLLRRERAIVTAQPGTTRDAIQERWSLSGIPVELIDTAGIRDAPEDAEAELAGIRRSREAMAEADLIVHVVDMSELTQMQVESGEAGGGGARWTLGAEDMEIAKTMVDRPHLVVLNKCDLCAEPILLTSAAGDALRTSAITGEGMAALEGAMVGTVTRNSASSEAAMLSTLRQHEAVEASLAALRRAQHAARALLAHEFILIDLYNSLEGLDRLTGRTTTDEILQQIFSTFCIGK